MSNYKVNLVGSFGDKAGSEGYIFNANMGGRFLGLGTKTRTVFLHTDVQQSLYFASQAQKDTNVSADEVFASGVQLAIARPITNALSQRIVKQWKPCVLQGLRC